MDKTLVILLGNARGGETTWNTMYEHLLKPFNADLALLFGESTDKSASLYSRAKYVWELPEYSNWREYYEKSCKGNWSEFFEKNQTTGMSGGIDNYIGSGAIIIAFRHYLKNNFSDILLKYDRIILTRADYYYLKDHPVESNEFFYIVEGEDYNGLCDRHHVFPSSIYEKVLGVGEFISEVACSHRILNIESALHSCYSHHALLSSIKRCERVQFAVKLKTDATRWSTENQLLEGSDNLYIKYPSEYAVALRNKHHE